MTLDANTVLVNVLVAQRNQALDALALTSRDLLLANEKIDDLQKQIINLNSPVPET